MSTTYDAAYFIAKFEAIPADAEATNRFDPPLPSDEMKALSALFETLTWSDGRWDHYNAIPDAKARILAVLRDIQAKQEAHRG